MDPNEQEMASRIDEFCHDVIDFVNDAKVHPIVAINALERVAVYLAIDSGIPADDLAEGVRKTYEQIFQNIERRKAGESDAEK